MPPKHKKKLTESEILESLTKPDLSIDQTNESIKSTEEELPSIDLNPTKKILKSKPPKSVETKKTEAEVLTAVVANDDEPKTVKRSNRRKTATETEPIVIVPPKAKAGRGRAKSQTEEATVTAIEAPKKPGRKPAKKVEEQEEQPQKKTPIKKGLKVDSEEAPVNKQPKKNSNETKDVASSTSELENLPVKSDLKKSGRPKKDAKKEEPAKSDSEELVQARSKRGAKPQSAKSDTEEVIPEKPEKPKKRSGRAASQVREPKEEETQVTKTDKKIINKEAETKNEQPASTSSRTRKASTQKKTITEISEPLAEKNDVKEAPEVKKRGRKPLLKTEPKNEVVEEPVVEEDKENKEKIIEKPKKKAGKGSTKVANAKITIEHCNSWSTYKRRANDLINALKEHLPDMEFVTNVTKPRRQSFELTLEINDQQYLVWTGIKITPRKAKFPEPEVLLDEIKKYLVE